MHTRPVTPPRAFDFVSASRSLTGHHAMAPIEPVAVQAKCRCSVRARWRYRVPKGERPRSPIVYYG